MIKWLFWAALLTASLSEADPIVQVEITQGSEGIYKYAYLLSGTQSAYGMYTDAFRVQIFDAFFQEEEGPRVGTLPEEWRVIPSYGQYLFHEFNAKGPIQSHLTLDGLSTYEISFYSWLMPTQGWYILSENALGLPGQTFNDPSPMSWLGLVLVPDYRTVGMVPEPKAMASFLSGLLLIAIASLKKRKTRDTPECRKYA